MQEHLKRAAEAVKLSINKEKEQSWFTLLVDMPPDANYSIVTCLMIDRKCTCIA